MVYVYASITYYALKAISILLQTMPNLTIIIQISYDSTEAIEIAGRNSLQNATKAQNSLHQLNFPNDSVIIC
ncbi:hypothetical protein BH18THE2_BH18THE2_15520 [soil metagenome]